MSEPQVMTIEQVNALIPELSRLVGRQLLLIGEIDERLTRLRALQPPPEGARPGTLAIAIGPDDSPEIKSLKFELLERVSAYEDGWQRVQELGAVVKDPRIGLLDFYGRVGEKLVWLCWRYGEESVQYYHALDAGFAGRKPIAGEVQKQLLN